MTNALVTRVVEHRSGKNPNSFAAKYKAHRLVYYEEYVNVYAAIAREKQIKEWTRAKKNALVESMNPQWRDLMGEWKKKYRINFGNDGTISAQPLSRNTRSFAPTAGAQDDKALKAIAAVDGSQQESKS